MTGLVSALLVVATVVSSFQRFENEAAYRRGMAFIDKIVSMYDDIFDMQEKNPKEFQRWLRGLVLYEPDMELYLLGLDGAILNKTGHARTEPGARVAIEPVLESVARQKTSFVMGDDPERMDAGAVVVAAAVRRAARNGASPIAGYLYLVQHAQQLPEGRWDILRSTFAQPVMSLVVAVMAVTTLLALLIITVVTKPLKTLTQAVATLSQRGLAEGLTIAPDSPLPAPTRDEFGQLTGAFEMLLNTCRRQWNALRRIDHYRREGVSNLSHDLRSPLTATVACLETLEGRWLAAPDRADDRRLVEIALRNTRNAARLVRSLGDLAKLDEPEYGLRTEAVDAGELLDDIALRFTERATRLGVTLRAQTEQDTGAGLPAKAPFARIDVELFERAVANLLDNALKFCGQGSTVTLVAQRDGAKVRVSVADDGPGIAASDLPNLFDRFYQSRQSVAPAGSDGGHGLGLAIVKRIVELHGGEVSVESRERAGTKVTIELPAAVA